MKVKRLIEELQKMNPEADVKLNDYNGYPLLFVLGYKNDENNVWLADEYDVDLNTELEERFKIAAEEQIDELDFYMDLLEIGIDVETVERNLNTETAIHMKEFCEEHGLI